VVHIPLKVAYSYPFQVVAWGWLIVVCDMRIYMLFEGRRYWPYPIRWCLKKFQQIRLNRLLNVILNPKADSRRITEARVEYAQYPVSDDGDPYVAFPTRLGNLIEAYEKYPEIKYGMDSVFYWLRLWVIIDKDLREEVDDAQSVVDSTVYISFAFYLSGVMMFVYAGIEAAGQVHWGGSWLSYLGNIHLPYVPVSSVLVRMGLSCLVAGFVIYRLSLTAHATFGELFKSVFDMHRTKLDLDDVVTIVSEISKDRSILRKPITERNRIAWLYLRWHRITTADGYDYTPKRLKEVQQKTPQAAAVAVGSTDVSASAPSTPTTGQTAEN
jgi:hypothetical protein